jgi:GAF domain-containing protein
MDNISKLEELRDKLVQAESVIQSICKIQGMYLINEPKEKIFNRLLDIILEQTKSEYGFIGEVLYDDAGSPFLKTFAITDISWNEQTRDFYRENAPQGLEFTNLNTIFGFTLKTGELVISNDPKNDPNAGGLPKGHPPLNAYLGVPLCIKGKMIGMFGVSNRDGGYSQDIVKSIQPIVDSVSQLVYAQKNNNKDSDNE